MIRFLMLGLSLLFVDGVSSAATIAVTPCTTSVRGCGLTSGATGFHPTGQTLGWEFTLSNTVTVTALGVYDLSFGTGGAGRNLGLGDSHAVGIYNAGGVLMVSGTVSPSGSCASATDDFCWIAVANTVLAAGTYRIGAYYSSLPADTDWIVENLPLATLGTAPGVTYVGPRNDGGSAALSNPTVVDSHVAGIFGPNFQFTPGGITSSVPEPASAVLLAAGLALLAIRARGSK